MPTAPSASNDGQPQAMAHGNQVETWNTAFGASTLLPPASMGAARPSTSIDFAPPGLSYPRAPSLRLAQLPPPYMGSAAQGNPASSNTYASQQVAAHHTDPSPQLQLLQPAFLSRMPAHAQSTPADFPLPLWNEVPHAGANSAAPYHGHMPDHFLKSIPPARSGHAQNLAPPTTLTLPTSDLSGSPHSEPYPMPMTTAHARRGERGIYVYHRQDTHPVTPVPAATSAPSAAYVTQEYSRMNGSNAQYLQHEDVAANPHLGPPMTHWQPHQIEHRQVACQGERRKRQDDRGTYVRSEQSAHPLETPRIQHPTNTRPGHDSRHPNYHQTQQIRSIQSGHQQIMLQQPHSLEAQRAQHQHDSLPYQHVQAAEQICQLRQGQIYEGVGMAGPSNAGPGNASTQFCAPRGQLDNSFTNGGRKGSAMLAPLMRPTGTSEDVEAMAGCNGLLHLKRLRGKHVRDLQEKLFACPHCPSRFKTRSDINRHNRIVHLKEKPYSCAVPGCESSFAEKGKLKRHAETVHEKLRRTYNIVTEMTFGIVTKFCDEFGA
jgi:hypothetical protein